MIEGGAAEVMDAIEATYGSLSDPSYSFVERAMSAQPYAECVDRLSNLVDVEDVTDVNDDVSFRYLLSRGPNEWALNLSMVGP